MTKRFLLCAAAAAAFAGCGRQAAYVPSASYADVPFAPSAAASVVWTPVGPSEPSPGMTFYWNPGTSGTSGKFNAVAVDPQNPKTIYVAGGVGRECEVVSQAGIFKSTDGGATWSAADAGLTDTYVNDLWIDPSNPQILEAATERDGIFASGNGGASWFAVAPGQTARMFVQAGDQLYAATSQGILVSNDQGASFQTQFRTTNAVNAIGYNAGTLYAGTIAGEVYVKRGANGYWKSAGTVPTFCDSTSGIRAFAVDPKNPAIAYAAVNGLSDGDKGGFETALLYGTSDYGKTWSSVHIPSSVLGSQTISFSDSGLLQVGGDVAAATYDGKKWRVIKNSNPNKYGNVFGDMRYQSAWPGGGVVVASDQGVWKANDYNDDGLYSLTAGLSVNLVTDLAVSGSKLAVTIQDAIPMQSQDGGGKWAYEEQTAYEDGSIAFGYGKNANVCVLASVYYYAYSSDGCVHFSRNVSYQNGGKFGDAQGQLIFDPQHVNTMYAIDQSGKVYVSGNAGRSISPTNWRMGGYPMLAARLTIDPKNDRTMYAVSYYSNYYYYSGGDAIDETFDGGKTWTQAKIACQTISAVAVDPIRPANVVAACFNTAGTLIYRSTDGGVTFAYAGTPIASNLRTKRNDYAALYRSIGERRVPLKSNEAIAFFPVPLDLAYNPSPPAGRTPALVLATSLGGAVSFDDGKTWASINGNAISTQWWRIGWSGGKCYVATRGQGVLMAPIQTK